MHDAIILGGGMVGSVMAMDLAGDARFNVTVADHREEALTRLHSRVPAANVIRADLSDPGQVQNLVRDCDIVLGALSSTIGFQTLRAVIEAGKNYCDISFMPEDALELDSLARTNGVTAVVDNGVAPGMSNMFVGWAETQLDEIESVKIYVGGLPRERRWPFEYKAGFSPADVIEEYTRPSRIVEYGRTVVREALSEPELLDFDGPGTLEAFNTDGLRSLADTVKAPHMVEKTLRYPGHIELMRVLRHLGLFSHEPIEVGPQRAKVRPIDVTTALLFPKWTYEPGEEDLTVMRIVVEGTRGGRRVRHTSDLYDTFDRASGCTSMSRTTALPNTIMARRIVESAFRRPGVNPPEFVGRAPGLFEGVVAELKERGIVYRTQSQDLQ
jgi:saccharopine dehydrogenase-like NADP-dependent oxidoreductase